MEGGLIWMKKPRKRLDWKGLLGLVIIILFLTMFFSILIMMDEPGINGINNYYSHYQGTEGNWVKKHSLLPNPALRRAMDRQEAEFAKIY